MSSSCNQNIMLGTALSAVFGTLLSVGLVPAAIALPQTGGQLISQETNDDEAVNTENVLVPGTTQVKARILSVTSDDVVRVRLEDGSTRIITLNSRNLRAEELNAGDDVYLKLAGDQVLAVSIEPFEEQQLVAQETRSVVQTERTEQRQEVIQQEQVQTETQVQQRPVTPAPAPRPAPAPAPQPVRGLW